MPLRLSGRAAVRARRAGPPRPGGSRDEPAYCVLVLPEVPLELLLGEPEELLPDEPFG